MEKIILLCKKRDERLDSLVKCIKYLFPECSMVLKTKEEESIYTEKTDFSYESYAK